MNLLYINSARVLVMEYLMGRRQLFLELFYCHVTLFRGLLHSNAARVLVVKHLIGRQQFFLELFYCYASACGTCLLLWEAFKDCICW